MSKTGNLFEKYKQRSLQWGKLFTITGGSQLLVQALGFLSGIVLIRKLPMQEYAYYTIANTMFATMTVLADAGVGAGVMSQGGKVWQDSKRLGVIVSTGLALRKRFALVSLAAIIPLLLWLLTHHGASWTWAIIISASLIPAFLAALSDSLLEIAPKLHQDIVPLQKNQISTAVARFGLTICLALIFPWAAIGLLAAGISRAWANIRLRKIAAQHTDVQQQPDAEVRSNILKVVKRSLPTSIYYCISGQLTVWLLSILGSTKSIGQIGALSGFSNMLNVFVVIFGTLFVPRFARLPSNKSTIVKKFLSLQCLLLVLGLGIVETTNLFSDQLLWILGNKFSGLHWELVLVAIQSSIWLAITCTHQMLTSRGIIVPPLMFIPLAIACEVGFAFIVPLGQLAGALTYGIYVGSAVYTIRIIYFTYIVAFKEDLL